MSAQVSFSIVRRGFEGLKVYETKDGSIVAFRPDQNAERMINSAKGMEMPPFPKERFLDALDQVVKANAAWVPPYGSGASLYIRPYMFASTPVIGVKPAEGYQFRILCTPVGPYFKGVVSVLFTSASVTMTVQHLMELEAISRLV